MARCACGPRRTWPQEDGWGGGLGFMPYFCLPARCMGTKRSCFDRVLARSIPWVGGLRAIKIISVVQARWALQPCGDRNSSDKWLRVRSP